MTGCRFTYGRSTESRIPTLHSETMLTPDSKTHFAPTLDGASCVGSWMRPCEMRPAEMRPPEMRWCVMRDA